MGWPYEFLDSTPEERHQRRLVLDRYGLYAQLFVLVPFTIALVFRVSGWASKAARSRYGTYDAIPDSPSLKSQRLSAKGTWATRVRQLRWWLDDDVFMFGQHWGQRDQWIFGSLWASLLLVLSVLETGTDYLHVTKRFAIVAASQFPIQYLLALKYLNPFAFVFRSSHEVINRWHRVLGRIIYMLLCLHAIFYLNFFIAKDLIRTRLTAPIVVAGVVAFLGLTIISGTALSTMRNYSYRLFFIAHLLIAFALPPILFFHAKPARYYVAEAFIVLIVDLTSRKMYTVTSQATCESIPGTSLIKISAPIPTSKANRFREQPGSHVYVSIPPETQMSPKPFSLPFLYNPFTVAAVNDDTGDLTLVARQRNGPLTSILARHAGGGGGGGTVGGGGGGNNNRTRDIKLPINIEGPHGAVAHFPSLPGSRFDRILLVAGGVGATFIVPIYRSIVHDSPNAKVDFVWAVRAAGDATWAVEAHTGKSIVSDNNVHIFLTGDIFDTSSAGGTTTPTTTPARRTRSSTRQDDSAEVEMSSLFRDGAQNRYTSSHNRKRPDLKKVVDDVFKHGQEERVAVLVCGPAAMGQELRQHVRYWVMKGRSVWWHNETFGW